MWWAQLLLGWPAILGSLLLSCIGVRLRKPGWLIAGAVAIIGFGWFYLAGSPYIFIKLVGYSLPLFNILAAIAVGKFGRWSATFFLFPYAAMVVYVGIMVLEQ